MTGRLPLLLLAALLAGCPRAAAPALPDPRTLGPFEAELERFRDWVQETPPQERAAIRGAAWEAVARYFVAVRVHLDAHGVAFAADPNRWTFRLLASAKDDLGRLAAELTERYRMALVYDVGFFARSSAGAGAATTPDVLFCDHEAIRQISGRTLSIAHEMEHVRTAAALKSGHPSPYHAWGFADFGWTNNVPFDELNAYDADVLHAAEDAVAHPGTVEASRLGQPAHQGLQRAELLVDLLERLVSSGAKLQKSPEKAAAGLERVSLVEGSDRLDLFVEGKAPPDGDWIRGQLRALLAVAGAHRARFQLGKRVADEAGDGPVPAVPACALAQVLARKTGEPPPAWQGRTRALEPAFDQLVAGSCRPHGGPAPRGHRPAAPR
jgi:hypothetical protein